MVYKLRAPSWRNERHAEQWWRSLERYAFPRIGLVPIDEIRVPDVEAVLSKIWHEHATTARKIRQRLAAVFVWSMANGLPRVQPR